MNMKKVVLFAAFLAGGMLYTGGTASLHAQAPMTTGIKVNGDWTIEVRNPGGDLVTRRTFTNHLFQDGGSMLASILARTVAPGRWQVILLGGALCPGWANLCSFNESVQGESTLTVSLSDGKLVLTGANTVTTAGDVSAVRTRMVDDGSPTDITGKTLTTIPVKVGQIIQVKVVISFS
jgi:hypothetical protein